MGRSIMVAVAMRALALAVGAGCTAASGIAASALETSSVHAVTPSGALALALATDAAKAGPAPVYDTPDTADDYALADSTEAGAPALRLTAAVTEARTYAPNTGLVAMPGSGEWRPLELAIVGSAPSGLDFLVARRASSNETPGVSSTSTGAELRLGQRIRRMVAPHAFQSPTSWARPAWYLFAASDGQALIYTPTTDPLSPNRNFTTQDRVNIGSMQAGISVEAHGMQASLAYVKRTITTMSLIRHEEHADEEFTGFTFTWRR